MDLPNLIQLMDFTPVIADINPVSLCYLPEDVQVYDSIEEIVSLLDQPVPSLLGRSLIRSGSSSFFGRFPSVKCSHNPFTSDINRILFSKYDEITKGVLCQSQIGDRIVSEASSLDAVVLLLIDGLSYRDTIGWIAKHDLEVRNEPCLVDTPTLTRIAFPNLIGSPSLATKLFGIGFDARIGYSYWLREDNALTNTLFSSIFDVRKIGSFPELKSDFQNSFIFNTSRRLFVQMIRTGLDGYAHSQRRMPPIEAILDEIWGEISQLAEYCEQVSSSRNVKVGFYITADHGVLWKDEFEHKVIGNAPAKASIRWSKWNELHFQEVPGRRFIVKGEEMYSLDYSHLRRPMRIDEQGVHGGISFQESFVPFISMRFG